MAKIGYLCQNQGQWENRQILSKAWVETSTRKHIETGEEADYGYQWWITRRGTYVAIGYRGQFIFVSSKKNIIVVITSDLTTGSVSKTLRLVKENIPPAVKSDVALPYSSESNHRLNTLINKYATNK